MKIHCDQCQAIVINGMPCHERDCLNEDKRWQVNEETGRIEPSEIYDRICPWCGCAFETENINQYTCCYEG